MTTTNIDHQHDSSSIDYDLIKRFFLQNLLDKWKMLARELDVDESDIDMISREKISTKEKFSLVTLLPSAPIRVLLNDPFPRFWI